MAGFLSKYTQITHVVFDKEFWADVRRYPSRGDARAAQDVLLRPTMSIGGDSSGTTTAPVDTGGFQNELVARALVKWNLTDDAGLLIPLGEVDHNLGPDQVRYDAVDILPEEIFQRLLIAVSGAATTPKEAKAAVDETFPRRDPGRAVGAVAKDSVAAGA